MALLSISGIGGYLPSDEVIFRLIKAGKLYIEIEAADKPSFLVPRKVRFAFPLRSKLRVGDFQFSP